jgi:hypothetical protein
MSAFLLYFRTAWNDYFSGTNTSNLDSKTYTSRQSFSYAYTYISNSLFKSIVSSSNGGALYCSSVTYLLIESTSFFTCMTSSQNGGAIFFSNSGGQSVLYNVCGYDCCTTYTGTSSQCYQFAYIYVSNTASSKNYFNYSSISRCVNADSNTHYILNFHCGKVCCPSVNISMNKCYYRSIYCYPFSDSNSFTCSFSHSSFTDNIAVGHTFFFLHRSGAKYEIKSCNILRNTQIASPSSEGTIAIWGNLEIKDSCILENTATYIFYSTSSSYRITLSNSTVDKTTNNGYLTTQNTVTKSFILALNHMSTLNCHSEYDSAGTLTPIIQTPSSSKKQRNYYTCDKFFYHLSQVDFASLLIVLIFNFLHLDFF